MTENKKNLDTVFYMACDLHDRFKELQVKEAEFKSLLEVLNIHEHLGFQEWIERVIINGDYDELRK